jgi:ADP-heptose:LPS heptosyltransferase/glycosyltransferase involved in cell wall biosynthesis
VTVLQLLPSLNYGGVETYVIRLSAGLVRRGHRVIIASSGGPLAEKCRRAGIRIVRLSMLGLGPPLAVLHLVRLIGREQVDLVNAHNWTAGAVGYLAARWAKVPFVLTIHGLRSPARRRLTFYWSKRVVVVSEKSRQHLVERFGLDPRRVVCGFIGVDTEEFAPRPASPAVRRLLGLEPSGPVVVHISRFSRGKAPVALALIEAGPALAAVSPGLQILLIGDGPLSQGMQRAAEQMNRLLGRRAVIVQLSRSDIPDVLALGAVVVGTATVALEALACAKPVVAAGKGGFVGTLTPENIESAAATSFGDHAEPGELPTVTAAALSGALVPLLTDANLRDSLGRAGREHVAARLSASHLAHHIEQVYREAIAPYKWNRVVLFHLNQIGDLLFCLPALRALRAAFPSATIASVVRPYLVPLLSCSPYVDEIIPRAPTTAPAPLIRLIARLRRLAPGLAVNFSSSAATTALAWICRAPQRIGFIDAGLSRLLTLRVQAKGVPHPAKVARLAKAAGAPVPDLSYVGLLAISQQDFDQAATLLESEGVREGEPLVALAPGASGRRRHKAWTVAGFAEVAQRLWEHYGFKSLIVGSGEDVTVAQRIAARMSAPVAVLAGKTTTGVLAAVLSRCRLTVAIDSGPMHVAAAMGCPVVALFGPTDPALTGPHGRGHCVVQAAPGPARRAMATITVDQVLAAAAEVLKQPRAVAAP